MRNCHNQERGESRIETKLLKAGQDLRQKPSSEKLILRTIDGGTELDPADDEESPRPSQEHDEKRKRRKTVLEALKQKKLEKENK